MTKSRDNRSDMASAHCSVEIDIVKGYVKDKNISYMGAVVIVIVWWLDVRPPVPITTNVVVRTRSWRDVLYATLCDTICQSPPTGQ